MWAPVFSTAPVEHHLRAYFQIICEEEDDREAEKMLKRSTISMLKKFANCGNFECAWQKVRRKKELIKALLKVRGEYQAFHNSVVASKRQALEEFQQVQLVKTRRARRKRKRDSTPLSRESESKSDHAFHSCVHIVPSGSGVLISQRNEAMILTCAHCCAHDDDDDEEEERRRRRRR